MAEKPVFRGDRIHVGYDQDHWGLLAKLRSETIRIIRSLGSLASEANVHGSLARGDVDADSDIDIIIPRVLSSHQVELAIANSGRQVYATQVSQATPSHAPKASFYLDAEEKTGLTFPLIPFRRLEWEFYRFGGIIDHNQLESDRRVPGITKSLTLIEPTPQGHFESPLVGQEAYTVKLLKLSPDIIKERTRVLTRRDSIGRTGVFLKKTVPPDQSVEQFLRELAKTNPALRRTLKARS